MGKNSEEIFVSLSDIEKDLKLYIVEEYPNSLFEIDKIEAENNGESAIQILEGKSYSYYFNNKSFQLKKVPRVVTPSPRKDESQGRITPNIYVGSLALEICKTDDLTASIKTIYIEVLPTKLDTMSDEQELDIDYRENYKQMLEDIATNCTELLMQINSPVNQNFQPDFEKDYKTIYQRFVFVKSLISSADFSDAVNKIIYSPSTSWKDNYETIDIRRTRRFTNCIAKQLITSSNRIKYQLNESIDSVPSKIVNTIKIESVDTPENRFIKFALESFMKFCNDCESRFRANNYIKAQLEVGSLITTIENYLEVPFFKEISRPNTLKLNSPILQRKSGYREVLNAWLLYDLAAKLVWQGGDKVYKAGKRDIAILYEYWLFFQLFQLFSDNKKFSFSAVTYDKINISNLIEETADGLGLKLKSGKETSLVGYYNSRNRKLQFKFSYNRTFEGNTKYQNNFGTEPWSSKDGSWTKPLRPDYTFSFWPAEIEETKAEKEDVIVHIHFDAKYKVKHFIINTENNELEDDGDKIDTIEKEKREERHGIYKNADLLKMHAYKDAIRRTGGAYVLYPGKGEIEKTDSKFRGFHEIIPGLGAFAVRPIKKEEGVKTNTGIENVSKFIDEIIEHFLYRASHSERKANYENTIYKNFYTDDNILKEQPLPEYIDDNKEHRLIPDETFVLVAYYKKENWDWIINKKLFNIRAGNTRGSLKLGPHETGAKYLLLHSSGETQNGKLFKVREIGPRIFSRKTLERINYPKDVKRHGQYYLVYKVEEVKDEEFLNLNWDITKLEGYKKGRGSALPFSATMTELMKTKKEQQLT